MLRLEPAVTGIIEWVSLFRQKSWIQTSNAETVLDQALHNIMNMYWNDNGTSGNNFTHTYRFVYTIYKVLYLFKTIVLILYIYSDVKANMCLHEREVVNSSV